MLASTIALVGSARACARQTESLSSASVRGGSGFSAFSDEFVSVLFRGLLVVLVGFEQVGGVQERALFLADVHEGGLYSGEDGFDPSEVDVADSAAMIGTIDQ